MADTRQSHLLEFGANTTYTLTGSYVASDAIIIKNSYQVSLDVAYTMGSAETGNSLQLKVEFSNKLTEPGSTDWFQMATTSTSSGTITVSLGEYSFAATVSAGTYDRFHLSIPVDAVWMRVSAKETGIASNGGTLIVRVSKTQSNA